MITQTPSPHNYPYDYVLPTPSTPAHFVYPKPLQKSEQDNRHYKLIRLPNGLQALLVHDPTADKAAASLDVAIGHLQDPDDMPGLAHFCEHLLFMGTEQFPKENAYSEFLSTNGGSSNAYTAASNTNYYFSVGTKAFSGALERFSAFFHCPLFSPSCTTRELNAVDSENKKNLQSDLWRIFQLNKHLTKPGHPWHKFGSGNKQSLTVAGKTLKAEGALKGSATQPRATSTPPTSADPSPYPSRGASPTPSSQSRSSDADADGGSVGRETRKRLVEWWSKEYCASRMGLTLIGKESLDELTGLAVTLFSPIRNRGQDSAPLIPDHPFGPDEMGTIVSVKTIMDFNAFELSFPLPWQSPLWRTKPGNFLGHFVGHEGPGSIHSYLKNKGWITSLSAGPQSLGRGFAMFKITIHLTKEGLQNYRAALLACYKYLSLLRTAALPAAYHDELQVLYAMGFRFAEKQRPDSHAITLAQHINEPIPRELLLSASQLFWEWDESIVRETLAGLTVDRGRVVLMAKDHTAVERGGVGPWEREPWYGTEYRVQRIDPEYAALAAVPNDIPELFLPGKNEFVPTNLDVEKRDVSQPLKRPILVRRTSLSSLWHKKDDQFWVPKAHVLIKMRSPAANASAHTSVMTRLYADLVNDALAEYAYDADMAGLSYNFSSHELGTSVVVYGYNDKLHLLTRHVLEKVKGIRIRPERLEVMKEQIKLEWQNFFLNQSHLLSDYYVRYLLAERQWMLSEKLAVVSEITVEDLQSHITEFLSRLSINILINGNLRKDEAIAIAEMTEESLRPNPLPSNETPNELSLILPEGCNFIWQTPVPNPNEVNSSMTYYCHVGDVINPRLRTAFQLLTQIITEPAFNVLRTKEQLGYIVFTSAWHGTGSLGLRIVVQSEKDPKYLENRVDAFLTSMRSILESMSDAQFEDQRRGLVNKWSEKLKNMAEETRRFWKHIDSGYLDFFRHERRVVILETVTRAEIMALYEQYIDPSSVTRSKLSVHLCPQKAAKRHFSVTAARALAVLLRGHGVPLDEALYAETSAAEPPIAAVQAHWAGVLLGGKDPAVHVDPAVGKMLVDAVEELGQKYPAAGEGRVELREGAVFIEDVKAFKAALRVSDPARPVEQFHDLPVSKF